MATRLRVALVGDYSPSVVAHQAIPQALRLSGEDLGQPIEGIWIHTTSISNPEAQLPEFFRDFDGIWCVPASPYASMQGALDAIRYARESKRPFLGTCGGFQHALIEYARNVCGLDDAEHAEANPAGSHLVITPLTCPLVERSGEILLEPGTRIEKAYGTTRIIEGYHCSYGLNPEYQETLFNDGLHATAHDLSGEVCAVELSTHPFFVATLFQSERRALRSEIPPLVRSFVAALRSG